MKVAIFVEGLTEAVFVKALVAELAGARNVAFVEERFFGGSFSVLYADPVTNQRVEVLVANCCSDGKVLTAIRDRHVNLVANGYQHVIGLRDIYPIPSSQLADVVAAMSKYIPQTTINIEIALAVAEVEAWFIEDETHFPRIDHRLDRSFILSNVGYDIQSGAAESVVHPANLLDRIYQLAGKAYKKTTAQINRTVMALDLTNLYINSRTRSRSLDRFIRILEHAIF